jgi:hypothetical protein
MPFMVQIGPPQISIHEGQTVLISEPDGQINGQANGGSTSSIRALSAVGSSTLMENRGNC